MCTVSRKTYLVVLLVLAAGLGGCVSAGAPPPAPTAVPGAVLTSGHTSTPIPPTESATLPPPTGTPASLPPTPTLPPVCQNLEAGDTPSDLSGRDLVTEMVTRLNAGDVSGAVAFFAEDARLYIYGLPPTGIELARGKEAICRTLTSFVGDNLEWSITILTQIPASSGSAVTSETEMWLDTFQQVGVAPLVFKDSTRIQDGRIGMMALWLSRQSLASLRTALPEAFARAIPGADQAAVTPASEVTIVFSDYNCALDGSAVWQAGEFTFNLEDRDPEELRYGLAIIVVDEGKDFFDLAIATGADRPAWVRYANISEFGDAWTSKTVPHSMVEGPPRYLMCLVDKVGEPVWLLGPIVVRP